MGEKKRLRNKEEWTKIDVKKTTRNRLQAYKYENHHANIDEILTEWLNKFEKD